MSRFQIGDKVRCREGGWGVSSRHIGKIFTIKEIGGTYGMRKQDGVKVEEKPLDRTEWNENWIGDMSFELADKQDSLQSIIRLIVQELKQ